MGILLVIVGIVLGGWALPQYGKPEYQRAVMLQGGLGNLIHLVCTIGSAALVIGGLIALFSN